MIPLGLYWLFTGLRGKRLAGQSLCRRCGYNLFGLPDSSQNCPECGADLTQMDAIASEIRHRRLGLAVGAVILMIGAWFAADWIDRWINEFHRRPLTLFEAVRAGDLVTVQKLIDREPALLYGRQNNRQKFSPPLKSAIFHQDAAIAKYLIDAGADPNRGTDNGSTSLHQAAERGSAVITRLLLDAGATGINGTDRNGATPLHLSVQSGSVELTRLLLEHGADPNMKDTDGITPLHECFRHSKRDHIKPLLDHGARIDTQDGSGRTPLHWALSRHEYESSILLIRQGADLSIKNNQGLTPVQAAEKQNPGFAEEVLSAVVRDWLEKGKVENVRRLLAAEPTALTVKGPGDETLLHAAQHWKSPDAIKLLLEAGADINAKDGHGATLLHDSALSSTPDNLARVAWLLDIGADLEVRDNHGRTPLMYAAQGNESKMVDLLIKRGARIDARDNRGATVATYAALLPHDLRLLADLLNRGAPPDIFTACALGQTDEIARRLQSDRELAARPANAFGHAPLHVAARRGQVDAIVLLLEHGAPIDAQSTADNFHGSPAGATPLHLSFNARDNLRTTRVLLDHGTSVTTADSRGHTAMHLAAMYDEATVELVLQYGGSMTARSRNGQTPLHTAAQHNKLATIRALLNAGADPHAQDKQGRTPLQYLRPSSPEERMAIDLLKAAMNENVDPTTTSSQ